MGYKTFPTNLASEKSFINTCKEQMFVISGSAILVRILLDLVYDP